jgi:hypothetical protein
MNRPPKTAIDSYVNSHGQNFTSNVAMSANPINFTSVWSNTTTKGNNVTEIANDVDSYKSLMIAGNTSAGGLRRVSIWDKLTIGNVNFEQALNVDGGAYLTGNLGIATPNPQAKLDVALFNNSESNLMNANNVNDVIVARAPFGSNASTNTNKGAKWGLRFFGRTDGVYNSQKSAALYAVSEDDLGYNRAVGLSFCTSGFDQNLAERMVISSTGNVGIGTKNAQNYKLAVEGTIGARKIKVTGETTWADYVFAPDYQLLPLQDLETYIKQHQHLPDVPTTEEVSKNGVDIGDTQTILLKKIEELTLYMIDLKKENESLKKRMAKIETNK